MVRAPEEKILGWEEAARWRARAPGPVVFTNGVFDLLHRGHADILLAARSLGGSLVVGINADASVGRLKGPGRPIRAAADRAYLLAAMEAVDCVVAFEQDTPLDLIRMLRPDVIVKGGDYTRDGVVGADDVEAWGGRVVIVPLTPGHSTTGTLERMRGG